MRLAALIVTLLLIVVVSLIGAVYAQEVTPPRGLLTGKHASLECDMCHQSGVWHDTNKDVTGCQKCHQNQWNTLTQQSMHAALMRNGTINREGATFQVKYCATCHDPHHNDYLRVAASDGKETYYKFDDIMPLCLNCHSLRDEARPVSNTITTPQNTNTPIQNTTTTRTTTTITTTKTNVSDTTKTTTATTSKGTTLSLVPSALTTPVSMPLVLRGQIDPSIPGTEIVVKGKSEGNTTWSTLGLVMTGADGEYELTWIPNSVGNFVLMASSGNIESGLFTVLVSESKPETEAPSMILGLFPSPLYLVGIVAVAAVALIAVLVLARKRKVGASRHSSAPLMS